MMGFNQPATLKLPANTATSVTLFRQATYPVWADQAIAFFHLVNGRFESVPNTIAGGNSTHLPRGISYWTVGDRPLASSTIPSIAGAPTASIPYPVLGRDVSLPGMEWLYVPEHLFPAVVLTVRGPTGFANVNTVNIEIWSSPGQVKTTSLEVTVAANQYSGYGSISLGEAAWVRIVDVVSVAGSGGLCSLFSYNLFAVGGGTTFTTSNIDAGALVVGVNTGIKHLPLVYPVEFANSSLPWYATKVTAAAMLGTNVSQVLNKGGTVLGGRISPAVQNAWTVTSTYVNGLHPAEKAYLPLETGVYTYAPPSTDLSNFYDYTLNTSQGAALAPVFLLSNDALYNKMYITATAVDETLACTTTWHVEFRTSSALFQIGLSPMTLESLHGAQLTLAEAGFFFENPEHDKLLNRVIAGAKKFAPAVAGHAASAVNPAMGRMVQSLVSRVLIPRSGPAKPPTTSAKRSGFGGPAKSGKKTGPQPSKPNNKKKGNGKGKR